MRPSGLIQLTPRQREVLSLAATGATYREIASQLGVTSKTARNHLANLYQKLEVHTRAEAVICAVRLGLVDLSDTATRSSWKRVDPVRHVGAGLIGANASSTSLPPAATIVVLKRPVSRRPQEGVNGRSS